MTLNEEINKFESNAEFERTHENLRGCQEFKKLAEWLKELKAYKEQEPCEDAISREAAIMCMTGVNLLSKKPEELISLFDKRIKALPSVTPKQKTGEWNVLGLDDLSDVDLYRCSECHMKITLKFNYCPNCGAKMVEGKNENDKY